MGSHTSVRRKNEDEELYTWIGENAEFLYLWIQGETGRELTKERKCENPRYFQGGQKSAAWFNVWKSYTCNLAKMLASTAGGSDVKNDDPEKDFIVTSGQGWNWEPGPGIQTDLKQMVNS